MSSPHPHLPSIPTPIWPHIPHLAQLLPLLPLAALLFGAHGGPLSAAPRFGDGGGAGGRRGCQHGRGRGGVVQEDALAAAPVPQVIVAGLQPKLKAQVLRGFKFLQLAAFLRAQLGLVSAPRRGVKAAGGLAWRDAAGLQWPLLPSQQP